MISIPKAASVSVAGGVQGKGVRDAEGRRRRSGGRGFFPPISGGTAGEGGGGVYGGDQKKGGGGRKKKALKREERAFAVPFRYTTSPSPPNRQNGKGDSSSSSSHRTHDYPKRPAAKKGDSLRNGTLKKSRHVARSPIHILSCKGR